MRHLCPLGGQADIPVREGAGKRGHAYGGGVLAGGFVAFLFLDRGFLFFLPAARCFCAIVAINLLTLFAVNLPAL